MGEALRRQVSRLTVERYRVERYAAAEASDRSSDRSPAVQVPTQAIPPHADRFAPQRRSLPSTSPDVLPTLPAAQLPDWIAAFQVT
ncbi:MAG: hypothetical protein EAZ61_13765, partial [Oscillatoriales cyanobacterium]